MNVCIFKQVSPSLKGPLQLYALHGPMFLFVDRLGFSLSPLGCGIKIVAVFVSAKNTLSIGTNPDPGSVPTHQLSKTNSHLHQMQATKQSVHADRSQEIQQPQTNANKTFSSQRLVWRQACFIMAPKTESKKLVLYNKKQIGTHREKKHVLTLTLMLVRCKSACKTSAGSSKNFGWLAPTFGSKSGPQNGAQAKT